MRQFFSFIVCIGMLAFSPSVVFALEQPASNLKARSCLDLLRGFIENLVKPKPSSDKCVDRMIALTDGCKSFCDTLCTSQDVGICKTKCEREYDITYCNEAGGKIGSSKADF